MKRQGADTTDARREFIAGISGEIHGEMNGLYGGAIVRDDLWDFALSLAFHENPRTAFRSSWALEWAYYHDRDAFRPHVEHFVANFLLAENPSVHRHYTKMMHDMLVRGIIVPCTATAEAIAERTFDLLIGPGTKTAVMVWAMEILYELSPRIEWLEEELTLTVLRILENNPSAGVANRAHKVLRRMETRKQ